MAIVLVALARQLAYAITAGERAACRGRGRWWTEREEAHATARSQLAAEAAAAPAMALCVRCPVLDDCRSLAELDAYTGLSAGAAYVGGVARPTGRLRTDRVPVGQRAG
jgi:hypothetical protein